MRSVPSMKVLNQLSSSLRAEKSILYQAAGFVPSGTDDFDSNINISHPLSFLKMRRFPNYPFMAGFLQVRHLAFKKILRVQLHPKKFGR
ncbi:hypothetical protein NV75_07475 [Oenococcus kitaharae]|nr:hypothetical protein NV75_07475 [Oenococcus kitaharae]